MRCERRTSASARLIFCLSRALECIQHPALGETDKRMVSATRAFYRVQNSARWYNNNNNNNHILNRGRTLFASAETGACPVFSLSLRFIHRRASPCASRIRGGRIYVYIYIEYAQNNNILRFGMKRLGWRQKKNLTENRTPKTHDECARTTMGTRSRRNSRQHNVPSVS